MISQPTSAYNAADYARRQSRRLRWAMLVSTAFVVFLWWLKALELWLGQPLTSLAVAPREPYGLIGVLTGPLLHGSLEHLFANTLPLLILGTLSGLFYPRASQRALPLIWIGSGLFVWLFGRPPLHLGASGLTHGLMFFIFLLGVLRRDRPAIAAGLIVFFLYGGMVLTLLPQAPDISWEYHFGGALFGALSAFLWRRSDPVPPRPKYSWELEEEEESQALRDRAELELHAPLDIPVLRQPLPDSANERTVVVPFPRPRHDSEQDDTTRSS